tara:strand:- start:69319 stop:70005 length:687 start_codon:yes stop_codon:yes gene_type:complete
MPSQQLTLPIQLRDDATFDNFFVSNANQLLLQTLQQADQWFVYLWGAAHTGKSHLLQACCHVMSEQGGSCFYLSLADYRQLDPQMLHDLSAMQLVCLDDVDAVAEDSAWQEAIFHLYNEINAAGHRLLVAANASANELGLSLADLQSRFNAGVMFHLQPLNETGKLQALQLRAHARGLKLSDEVGNFLLTRWSRDMQSLFDALEKLDQIALTEKRKLTIPLVKASLNL